MDNFRKNINFISILIIFNIFLLGGGFFFIDKNLKENKHIFETLKSNIYESNKQLGKIIEDINISNREISSLNIQISVLNEELNVFNKSIIKNEDDLTELQLKLKDVIVDIKKVKDMTELQNRKLYVSE
tara:strand:- start:303 stop:689 length:387 start_codon:yes stop_codon:yes gene_type:complete